MLTVSIHARKAFWPPLPFIRSFQVIAINSEVKAVVCPGRYVIVLP